MGAPSFTMGHTGDNSHTFGSYQSTRHGIFFSDNPDFAGLYGKVGKYTLHVRRTLDFDADRMDTLYKFIDSLDAFSPAERPIWLSARNVVLGHWQPWQLFEDELGAKFVAYLQSIGYDSVSFQEFNLDDDEQAHQSHTIVVLDPKLVHVVSSGSRY